MVRRLLAEGAGVNTRDGRGRTALLAATQRNHVDVARLLINEGADVNAKDFIQDTPFLVAGAEGRAEILKLMLVAEPDLKSVNRFGGTALIPACHRGHVEAVKLLLTTAIDKDHVNHLGLTALMEAVVLGDGGPGTPRSCGCWSRRAPTSIFPIATASRRLRMRGSAATPHGPHPGGRRRAIVRRVDDR